MQNRATASRLGADLNWRAAVLNWGFTREADLSRSATPDLSFRENRANTAAERHRNAD